MDSIPTTLASYLSLAERRSLPLGEMVGLLLGDSEEIRLEPVMNYPWRHVWHAGA
jgi:hypothetical protein